MNPTPTDSRRRFRILLAEDNAVNQLLVRSLLQRRGHDVVLATTGRDVLMALERQKFDVILMDVQMPELDGLEATSAIRGTEAAGGRFATGDASHIPIIAMTGQSTDDDRNQCLACGMDAYLAKPIQPDSLYGEIDRVLGCDPGSADVVNRTSLEAVVGAKPERYQKLVDVFLLESQDLMAEIASALAAGDAARLRRAAHSLKGAAAVFSAGAATSTAQRLESCGETGNLDDAPATLERLKHELETLKAALTTQLKV